MIERSLINIDERAVEIGTAYCSSENFVYSVHLNTSGKPPITRDLLERPVKRYVIDEKITPKCDEVQLSRLSFYLVTIPTDFLGHWRLPANHCFGFQIQQSTF